MRIDGFLKQLKFVKCITEHGVYVRHSTATSILIICLYVDDLLITGSSEKEIAEFKTRIMKEFDMSDLGVLSYFLGIEFTHTSKGIFMSRKKYAKDVLKRFSMMDCNSACTPAESGIRLQKDGSDEAVDPTYYKQIVGSLRYLCNTRPDLAYIVGVISRFMEHPRISHLAAAKRILQYVKGSLDFGILYPNKLNGGAAELLGYCDSDWCGDKDDRKSTTGYVFMVGGKPVSWYSKKQDVVALSSCEAEYVAASVAACQALWLETLLEELKLREAKQVKLLIDNKSAIDLAKHPIAHGRSKHIETKYHFLRDQVSKDRLKMQHCRTEEQLTDILTKPLKNAKFVELRCRLGVQSITNLN